MDEIKRILERIATTVDSLAGYLEKSGLDTDAARAHVVELLDMSAKVDALEEAATLAVKKELAKIQASASAMDRILAATGTKTQMQLAELLEVRQSSISDAKRRGSVPAPWLVTLLRTHNLNPDWVLTGEGPMYLVPAEAGKVAA